MSNHRIETLLSSEHYTLFMELSANSNGIYPPSYLVVDGVDASIITITADFEFALDSFYDCLGIHDPEGGDKSE